MPEADLTVENVTVTYGSGRAAVRALDDVSLTFHAGQLTLVTGPSGSGKTTLLSVLGCLLKPDSGCVRLMGQSVSDLSEDARGEIRRNRIGYAFQAFRLFRALSALENVLIALEISGRSGREATEQALRSLESVGLSDKRRLKPKELSGGEKQRVAIARALINDPPILLADEPTASLDSASGGQVAEMLLNIAEKQNRLVVVVSHDQRWLDYSHRVVTLRDGMLVQE